MTDWLLPFLCGLGAAVISAWGVGGGTLLLLVMTLFLGVDQRMAQGINLLFFLPTAISALLCHWQKGYLDTHPHGRPPFPWLSRRHLQGHGSPQRWMWTCFAAPLVSTCCSPVFR